MERGRQLMLGCVTTDRTDSPYVNDLLNEVEVLLTESVAGSTANGYAGHWKRWVNFCAEHGLVPLPAVVDQLCAYFLHLATVGNSMSAALSARAAVGFFHKLQLPALESPTDSVRVSMTFAGLKRRYAKPPKKAMKFTPDTLRLVRDHLMGGDPVSLKNFRMAAWAVASWHTMGRYEELAKVRFENVKVLAEGSLELFVECAKQYAKDDPRTGVVAATGREDCPVDFLLSYMDFARDKFPAGAEMFLFPSLTPKNIPMPKTMSYQSALRQLRAATSVLNIPVEDCKRFGLHSCRGGAATAASNAGVPLQAIKEAGRWTSDSAPRGYIQPSEEVRGLVSRTLSSLPGASR